MEFVILSYFKCGSRELLMHLGIEYNDVLTANLTIYFYPKSNVSIFLLHHRRKADPDSFWPLGCCDVSGQVRVLHWRGLLHRVGLQRCHSSSVVLEWKAPHHRGQPQQQWVETACCGRMFTCLHSSLRNGMFLTRLTLFSLYQVTTLLRGQYWQDMTTRWCVCLCVQSWVWSSVELKVCLSVPKRDFTCRFIICKID